MGVWQALYLTKAEPQSSWVPQFLPHGLAVLLCPVTIPSPALGLSTKPPRWLQSSAKAYRPLGESFCQMGFFNPRTARGADLAHHSHLYCPLGFLGHPTPCSECCGLFSPGIFLAVPTRCFCMSSGSRVSLSLIPLYRMSQIMLLF